MSGEVEGGERRAEGGHWEDDEGQWRMADGGQRTEISFYFVLVIPPKARSTKFLHTLVLKLDS